MDEMEKAHLLKEIVDYFNPQYFSDFINKENTSFQDKNMQAMIYLWDQIQPDSTAWTFEWECRNSHPYTEKIFDLLQFYDSQTSDSDNSKALNLLDNQWMDRWTALIQRIQAISLDREYPLGNVLYGLCLLFFMNQQKVYDGNKEKIVIRAQQFCFLPEPPLKALQKALDTDLGKTMCPNN